MRASGGSSQPLEKDLLSQLLDALGVSLEQQLEQKGKKQTEIEVFLGSATRISHLQYFPNLTELSIIQQSITHISDIHHCASLRVLRLSENKITRIKGLEQCTEIHSLYLNKNRIAKIENLENLQKLKTLWLSENQISVIENLQALGGLETLWLGQNLIQHIGSGLDRCHSLQELNLAGNRIGNFRGVASLSRLSTLSTLWFGDRHFGHNPICRLSNYQIYVLYHLVQLNVLDSVRIPDELKQIAEATFTKKKMYYNMRMKTLRRNAGNIVKQIVQVRKQHESNALLALTVLLRQQRSLQREIDEQEYGIVQNTAGTTGVTEKSSLESLRDALASTIAARREAHARFTRILAASCEQVGHIASRSTQRLLMELESGGNVRLEEGSPSDVWYASCADLVKSRFYPSETKHVGVTDIKVSRVLRIHHRFLRNRFDAELERTVNTSHTSYKNSLEYLFYAPSEGDEEFVANELMKVVEDGFPRPAETRRRTGHDAVRLANSVPFIDRERLGVGDVRVKAAAQRESHEMPRRGSILVVKAFLAKHCAANAARDGSEIPIRAADYTGFNSVFRSLPSDPKQREWFVFNEFLLLPEYTVEYEYVHEDDADPDEAAVECAENLVESQTLALSSPERVDVLPMLDVLRRATWTCCAYDRHISEQDDLDGPVELPQLPVRGKAFALTEELVTTYAGPVRLSALEYLNLHANSIRSIQGLADVSQLRILILSFNELQRIDGIEHLRQLERLDLAFNLIKRIENLAGLSKLRHLELNNNLLYRLEDIHHLSTSTPHLESLSLSSNTLCESRAYRGTVLRALSELVYLDERLISPEERLHAYDTDPDINDDLILRNATLASPYAVDLAQASSSSSTSQLAQVDSLSLAELGLRKISGLHTLSSLRDLDASKNEISRIEGLDQLVNLEKLNLEDNRIMSIENLNRLERLQRLDLGRNRIAKLENIDPLQHLTQLSLEDNEIGTLQGFPALPWLMELYLGNNKIRDMSETLFLRECGRLIILDLSGNPMCDGSEYRLYVIFQLRRLKVLDGRGIDADEHTSAKDKYAGKVTKEFLIQHVGHQYFEHVRELDLSSSKIRHLGPSISASEFPNLRILNLDDNLLVDLGGALQITTLQVLRANHNRLEAIAEHNEEEIRAENPGFHALVALEILQIGFNAIQDVRALRLDSLANLKVLFLQGNDIARVQGLEGLVQLRELVLDKNRIRALEPDSLASLKTLRELRIEENSVRSLDHFLPLPKIQILHMASNRITDIAELEKLAGLSTLIEISLASNPVARKPLYRPALIRQHPVLRVLDGKEVTEEERERVALLFAPDPRAGPAVHLAAPFAAGPMVPRVPIRMTAMTFDSLAGISAGQMPQQNSEVANAVPLDRQLAAAASGASSTPPMSGRAPTPGRPSDGASVIKMELPPRRTSFRGLSGHVGLAAGSAAHNAAAPGTLADMMDTRRPSSSERLSRATMQGSFAAAAASARRKFSSEATAYGDGAKTAMIQLPSPLSNKRDYSFRRFESFFQG